MTTVTRVGAIGDIHAEDVALQIAIQFLVAEHVDGILAVGDIVNGLGDTLRCCELLQEHNVDVVRGNHDRWLLKDAIRKEAVPEGGHDAIREYLAVLPTTLTYETPAGSLLLCHGLGANDMNRLTPDDYGYGLEANDELQELLATHEHRFVINGHTHRRMVKDFGGVTVINVGTLFREHQPCFAIVDFKERLVRFFDVNVDGVVQSSQSVL